MKYQAVISGLGEHIHVPIEADNDKQAYARAHEHAARHLPKLLSQHVKVSLVPEGEQAIDDRDVLQFSPPEGKMGRPSQGRSYRLQASITPGLATWLEHQKQTNEKSISDVVFRLLEQSRAQQ